MAPVVPDRILDDDLAPERDEEVAGPGRRIGMEVVGAHHGHERPLPERDGGGAEERMRGDPGNVAAEDLGEGAHGGHA
jgi:hypothetical protein